jgi:hypothetical protein
MSATCALSCAKDTNPSCSAWAGAGECTKNAVFMGAQCALSCCSPPPARA